MGAGENSLSEGFMVERMGELICCSSSGLILIIYDKQGNAIPILNCLVWNFLIIYYSFA